MLLGYLFDKHDYISGHLPPIFTINFVGLCEEAHGKSVNTHVRRKIPPAPLALHHLHHIHYNMCQTQSLRAKCGPPFVYGARESFQGAWLS